MNKLEIIRDNDFPVTAKTLRFLQTAYQELQHLAKMYGDNCILYGCDLAGGSRTAGAIVINGEVMPFFSSPNNLKIKVFEDVENAIYKGGEVLPAYYVRYAKCDGTGDINLADLRRVVVRTAPIPKESDWVICPASSDVVVVEPIQVRMNDRGNVQVRGKFKLVDRGMGRICNVPDQFIPTYPQTIQMKLLASSQKAYTVFVMKKTASPDFWIMDCFDSIENSITTEYVIDGEYFL